MLGITLLLALLAKSIFRDSKKIAIIISVLIILFFSYGHIYDLILDKYIFGIEIGRHRYLLLAWGLIFTCTTYFIIRIRRNLNNLTSILNIAALSLVIVTIFNIGVYELKTKNKWHYARINLDGLENVTTNSGYASEFPDIYYIILDGYASSSTLKDIYDFDNQYFIDYLISKGFYVATKSQSNYPMTMLSLASSLNMKHLNYLTDIVGLESEDPTIPYQMIRDSEVMKFLKLKGYKFIHFSSTWGATASNKYADIDFSSGKVNEFLMALIRTSILRPIEGFVGVSDLRKTTLRIFSKLPKLQRIKEPKFIFAHIIPPHPPYLFKANGEPVPGAEITMNWILYEQKDHYLNQLIFINKKVEMLVDDLLLNSESPPIIIIQADHGPGSTFSNGMYSMMQVTKKRLKERMTILNAYYLPSGGNALLYDSITPVNTFRLILDFYFGTNNGLLDDQCYFSTYGRPYDFMNVTDSLKYH